MPASLLRPERLLVRGRVPRVLGGLRIYAIGDIHGRLDLLDMLLERIRADIARRPTARPLYVFLGDYVDRGPSSRETIDRLIEHSQSSEVIFLKGNHEQITMKCLTDRALFERWMRLGGAETLISYGVTPLKISGVKQIVQLQSAFHNALPQNHFRFFKDLRASYECGDFFFAHAGVKPDVDLSRQKETDLLWIRDEFLGSSRDFGKIIVHGHTPNSQVDVAPNRINIDTGAYATGCLTCLVLEDDSLSVIDTVQTLPNAAAVLG